MCSVISLRADIHIWAVQGAEPTKVTNRATLSAPQAGRALRRSPLLHVVLIGMGQGTAPAALWIHMDPVEVVGLALEVVMDTRGTHQAARVQATDRVNVQLLVLGVTVVVVWVVAVVVGVGVVFLMLRAMAMAVTVVTAPAVPLLLPLLSLVILPFFLFFGLAVGIPLFSVVVVTVLVAISTPILLVPHIN
mmetsp:Transcript_26227/g.45123  ORF Transcript_26227/g.45123 Transcript_26227/m.45123 type:complete len:191 (-) Transcript_26227:1083-1655(-)